jgi:circadian clock protein KaiC
LTRASYWLALPSRLRLSDGSTVETMTRPETAEAGPAGLARLAKAPTGIRGLDEVTGGGLPRGRPTLVCGSAGSGKTLLAMEFLVRGISQFDEPGVFMAFEETREDLVANVASLGFDLAQLEADGKLVLDHVNVVPAELVEAGSWDLEGLFIRLGAAIDRVGAQRVVIDTIETLFGAVRDTATLRSELQRLFLWLKDRGVTAVITGERGDGALTRHGIEEYVSDCVIVLDQFVSEEMSTRRLRVLKYRGSLHGTNQYPFLIGEHGISVQPITSLGLKYGVSTERISTGVARLDLMLGGSGPYRGSSVLVSGSAGTGKSTLAAQFCDAACRRGERAMYYAFEESRDQIIRNMSSVGMDLAKWEHDGLLRFVCVRPKLKGLEAHLSAMQTQVEEFDPAVVVLDPISDQMGSGRDVGAMLTRQVDFLKSRGISALFTSLGGGGLDDPTDHSVASMIDTWLVVRSVDGNGEHNRALSVLKSRGMAHSNQLREFLVTDRGIELADVYVGPQGVLTGSARSAQEAKERTDAVEREEDLEQRRLNLQRQRESVEAEVAGLWRKFEDEADTVARLLSRGTSGREDGAEQRIEQGRLRRSDPLVRSVELDQTARPVTR